MVTIQQRLDRLMIRIGGEALFQPGQTSLRPESRRILDNVIGVLQAFPNYRIRVEGHTDSIPVGAQSRWTSNWELSAVRAAAVARYLEDKGIDPERLFISGFSFYHPVAPNETPEGRAQNRRIEILLLPPVSPEDGASRP
jgi:chemotaxis protein MotB